MGGIKPPLLEGFPSAIGYTEATLKYIWRKRAGTRWWRDHSESFEWRFGSSLAVIQQTGKERVMLEIFCATERQGRELARKFGGGIEPLRRDWLQHWMKQARAKPLRIGSRLLILSAPAQRVTSARSIVIPAEAAFGTGHHATTAMCLRLLEGSTRHLAPGWTMLDAGTGTGILAIAGRYFGAGRVLAIDHDPLACATAKRNARANGIRNIEFSADDVLKQKLTRKLDVITANLFSEILIAALPLWSRHLVPGGHLILSGVLRSQESAVLRALRRHRFNEPEIRRRGKWIALHARK